jgi:hypothetical protein
MKKKGEEQEKGGRREGRERNRKREKVNTRL